LIIKKIDVTTGLEDVLFPPVDIESDTEKGENADNEQEDFTAVGVQNNQVAAGDGERNSKPSSYYIIIGGQLFQFETFGSSTKHFIPIFVC
jgi:hypothetical protein